MFLSGHCPTDESLFPQDNRKKRQKRKLSQKKRNAPFPDSSGSFSVSHYPQTIQVRKTHDLMQTQPCPGYTYPLNARWITVARRQKYSTQFQKENLSTQKQPHCRGCACFLSVCRMITLLCWDNKRWKKNFFAKKTITTTTPSLLFLPQKKSKIKLSGKQNEKIASHEKKQQLPLCPDNSCPLFARVISICSLTTNASQRKGNRLTKETAALPRLHTVSSHWTSVNHQYWITTVQKKNKSHEKKSNYRPAWILSYILFSHCSFDQSVVVQDGRGQTKIQTKTFTQEQT